MDFNEFDIISYLEDRNIEYFTEGKNVTQGWVNITCPFCSDDSDHCGINLESKFFSCWICGKKGNPVELIKEIENISFKAAYRILDQYKEDITGSNKSFVRSEIKPVKNKDFSYPQEFSDSFLPIQKNYLRKRHFDPQEIIRKYSLKSGGLYGDWRFRLIFPIYQDRELVTFTSRDTTGNFTPYKNCPNEKSIIDVKHTLYGIDGIKDEVLIVEGLFDKLRMGDLSICTYGTKFTGAQVNLLIRKKLRRAFIMFDGEEKAIIQAYKLAKELSPFISQVEVLELPEGSDPGSLSEKEAQEITNDLFGKK